MRIEKIYLLILHIKGVDYSSGYGEEVTKGFALTKEEADQWVSGLKENGFERRIYKTLNRRL